MMNFTRAFRWSFSRIARFVGVAGINSLRANNRINRVPFRMIALVAPWFKGFLGVQLFYIGMLSIGFTAIWVTAHLASSQSWLSLLTDAWPINWDQVIAGFRLLLVSNLLWSLIVFTNHYNDLATMMASLPWDSFSGSLGHVWAFWYATCWTMSKEFFTILTSNPTQVVDTRVIMEIAICWDNCMCIVS